MKIVLVGTAIVVSGCAAVGSGSLQKEKCSNNVIGTVERFLMGVTEMNLGMIRSVVLDGISPLSIFGNGDASHGRKIVGGIVDHPEIHRGNEVDSTYHWADIKDTSEKNIKEVSVERHDRVMLMRNRHSEEENIQTIEQHSRQTFIVTFDAARNCILAVKLIDPEWINIP
jgi:hypothetical protein